MRTSRDILYEVPCSLVVSSPDAASGGGSDLGAGRMESVGPFSEWALSVEERLARLELLEATVIQLGSRIIEDEEEKECQASTM